LKDYTIRKKGEKRSLLFGMIDEVLEKVPFFLN
jgi:hypothetical protein